MFELDEDSIVTLTDEEGVDVDFLMLDVVEYEGGDYMVLLPLDTDEQDDDEEDDVLILKVEKDDEGEKYLGIDDETVMNAVFALFQQRVAEAMKEAAEAVSEEE
ncbi:MAG: DUF1292 domain-containing protein [Clostridia bacterium]|nr:DUF1292 domain-containing protein [Clostridia bacterium]